MKVFCCQFDIVWKNKAANFQKVESLLDAAQIPPGSLIVIPEMFATGFCMASEEVAEGNSSETAMFLQRLAAKLSCYCIAGLATAGGDGRSYNEALVLAPDGNGLGRYRKIHPFSFAKEDEHYCPGKEVMLFDLGGCWVSPFICYDLRFPEVFRRAVQQGAQVFSVIANWPSARKEHWLTLLRARAVENQAFVVGTNRCGSDPSSEYPGLSVIVDPRGQVLAQAGSGECVITAEIQLAELLEYRRTFPALKDIVPEATVKVIRNGLVYSKNSSELCSPHHC